MIQYDTINHMHAKTEDKPAHTQEKHY